jgi:hypothetical protein
MANRPAPEDIQVALYSVYAQSGAIPALVPDRFSWFAALLPPVYAMLHGLWLALVGYAAALVLLGALSLYVGEEAVLWLYLLLALLIGLEAPTLRRRKLARRGYGYRGEVVAQDEDVALGEALKRQ